jgi:hypothetical protein
MFKGGMSSRYGPDRYLTILRSDIIHDMAAALHRERVFLHMSQQLRDIQNDIRMADNVVAMPTVRPVAG